MNYKVSLLLGEDGQVDMWPWGDMVPQGHLAVTLRISVPDKLLRYKSAEPVEYLQRYHGIEVVLRDLSLVLDDDKRA